MAGTTVTGDLYRQIDGKLGEVKRQLRQKGGYPFDPLKLQKGLQALIEGRFPDDFVSVFSRDMTKEGWTLVEGFDEPDPAELSATEFEFVPILKQGEIAISGEEMRRRSLQENANLGQRFGEWLLAHPEKMPARPGDIYWIPLPKTVWRDRDGRLSVPCLGWGGGRWGLNFGFLEDGWDSDDGFLRPRK